MIVGGQTEALISTIIDNRQLSSTIICRLTRASSKSSGLMIVVKAGLMVVMLFLTVTKRKQNFQ